MTPSWLGVRLARWTKYKPDCNQTLVPVVDARYPKQNFSVRKIRCENVFVLMMPGPIWIGYDRLLIIWLILLLSTRCLSYSMGENVEHYHGIFAADLLKYFRLEHEPKRARMRDKPLRQKIDRLPTFPTIPGKLPLLRLVPSTLTSTLLKVNCSNPNLEEERFKQFTLVKRPPPPHKRVINLAGYKQWTLINTT